MQADLEAQKKALLVLEDELKKTIGTKLNPLRAAA
jgi:hypothetical protein